MVPGDSDLDSGVCRWIGLGDALRHFATFEGRTQSQRHIKPLHWYAACRLVVEGGFNPEDVTPRPPFVVVERRGSKELHFDPEVAGGGEATVFGGLKTKDVDVVVAKPGLGPVLAVSCKGLTGALRNLTNRMEETIGECTNLHMTYPALVFGYLFVIRANLERMVAKKNDISVTDDYQPVEAIVRFCSALRELAGRRGIRDDISGYEAVSVGLVRVWNGQAGRLLATFPTSDDPLHVEKFFATLYRRYEERFVLGAESLRSVTERVAWSPVSPGLAQQPVALDYPPRLSPE